MPPIIGTVKSSSPGEGVLTGSRLEDLMKDEPEYRHLPSDVAQETLKKLSEAWKGYFELRPSGARPRIKTRSRACPNTARTAKAASGRST
jgi:hypothetical protein